MKINKYLFGIAALMVIEISAALYLTFWREHFWNAIAQKHSVDFLTELGVFTAIALSLCFMAGVSSYLVSLTGIKWREVLNSKAFAVREQRIENMNQRIQEDCMSYPDLVLNLGLGAAKSALYLIVFIVSLLLSFSWWLLIFLIGYSIIGTVITHYIARPLISLNYHQQRIEATYRNDLTVDNFSDCIIIMLGLAKKQKHLTYFQQFYSQLGIVLPVLLIAPLYFNSTMTLGQLMRFNSLSSTILDNMSYGISNFGSINKLLSCRKRLMEAGIL